MKIDDFDVIIVGAGLSGAVLAERIGSEQDRKVLVLEKRDHVAGNCHDAVNGHGIRIHTYGPHFFHTDDVEVWNYVNKFANWCTWHHQVQVHVDGIGLLPFPPNLDTMEALSGGVVKDEATARKWLEVQCRIGEVINAEDQVIRRAGRMIYEKIFKGYSEKQWGRPLTEMAPEVTARIPIRMDCSINLFSDRFQALPEKGYTHFVTRILKHRKIHVELGVDFDEVRGQIKTGQTIVFTGRIDRFFTSHALPDLEYRSLRFEAVDHQSKRCLQEVSVVNFPDQDVPHTRSVEYKHLLKQKSDYTTIVREYPSSTGDPYYPVPTLKNYDLYSKYQDVAASTEPDTHFVGRLANYRYFDMDQAIRNALDYFRSNLLEVRSQ